MQLVKEDTREYWVNDRGEWHGEYKRWDENGQLSVHCFFVNGRYHGEAKLWWYENGQLRRHCFFVNDEFHGEYKSWRDNGQLSVHCFYVNGDIVRDLIEEPVTDEDKFLMSLETGAKWLDINS